MRYTPIQLIKRLKELKPKRKNYYIKPTVNFKVDTHHYYISLIPTITWCPWIFRYPNTQGVIDIWWLHFHICIGTWVPKKEVNE